MGYEIDGNIIRVAPHAKLAAEQRSREEARAREQKAKDDALKAERDQTKEQVQLEPRKDEVIEVNYAKPMEVAKALDRLKTPGRTDVNVATDERTSRLIIRETEAGLARMKKLLRDLDRATPQVLIEARLIEATRNFSQSLGIEWGFAAQAGGKPVSIFGSPAALVGTDAFPLAITTPTTSPRQRWDTRRGPVQRPVAIGAHHGGRAEQGRTLSTQGGHPGQQEAEINREASPVHDDRLRAHRGG
jgi:type IV pilus assembly protein PilQ